MSEKVSTPNIAKVAVAAPKSLKISDTFFGYRSMIFPINGAKTIWGAKLKKTIRASVVPCWVCCHAQTAKASSLMTVPAIEIN